MKFINLFKAFSNTFLGGIFLIISIGYIAIRFIGGYLFKTEFRVYYSYFFEFHFVSKLLISFVIGFFLLIISLGILTLINDFKTQFIQNLKE